MRRSLPLRVSLSLVLIAAGLVACGDHRLTVSGHARLEGADLRTGFEFPADVRIDGEGAARGVTGSCQIVELADDQSAVVVDLFGGSGDEGLRSLTLRARTDDGSSSAEARLATATFSAEASCAIDVTYVDDSGSVTLDTSRCAMSSTDATATLDAHLELHGCSVVDD